jgi:hypothetical protein
MSEARKKGKGRPGYRMGQNLTTHKNGQVTWTSKIKIKTQCTLTLQWTPGHEGIRGNEEIDQDAKKAAEGDSSPNRDLPAFLRSSSLPLSTSAAKQSFQQLVMTRWKAEWTRSKRHRKMQRLDDTMPSNKFLRLISDLDRNQSSILLQLRTGHIPLNEHLFRIKKAISPNCPHCTDTPETVLHFLVKCPHYRHERQILRQKLKNKADSIKYLLSEKDALEPLLKYIHSTARLRHTFGVVEPKTL